jgi:hypothetical protein
MGVIHMNGRIYDPLIGRFMSADPRIQAPYNLKSFNRYSYVWNNPLKFFDPTGFGTDANGNNTGEDDTGTGSTDPDGETITTLKPVIVTARREDPDDPCGGVCSGSGSQGVPYPVGSAPPATVAAVGGSYTGRKPISQGIPAASQTPKPVQKIANSSSLSIASWFNAVMGYTAALPSAAGVNIAAAIDAAILAAPRVLPMLAALSVSGDTPKAEEGTTDSEKKPKLESNPKHHPNSDSPEPGNVKELYDKSVPDKNGVRWTKDENGEMNRFSKPSNDNTHWNGTTDPKNPDPIQPQNIPNQIKRYWGY